MLVFTGGEGLAPQGIIPLQVDITEDEVRFQMLSHSIPLILNFNKKTKHLIQSLPLKVVPVLPIHKKIFFNLQFVRSISLFNFLNPPLSFITSPIQPSLTQIYHLTHSDD